MNIVKKFFSTGWKYTLLGAAIPVSLFTSISLIEYPWNGLCFFTMIGAWVGLGIWAYDEWKKSDD